MLAAVAVQSLTFTWRGNIHAPCASGMVAESLGWNLCDRFLRSAGRLLFLDRPVERSLNPYEL